MTELRFAGDLDLAHITQFAADIPEVQEVLTVAGDSDALVRVRVNGIEHLQKVVNRLRTGGGVTGTKTLVVLESWIRRACLPGPFLCRGRYSYKGRRPLRSGSPSRPPHRA